MLPSELDVDIHGWVKTTVEKLSVKLLRFVVQFFVATRGNEIVLRAALIEDWGIVRAPGIYLLTTLLTMDRHRTPGLLSLSLSIALRQVPEVGAGVVLLAAVFTKTSAAQ